MFQPRYAGYPQEDGSQLVRDGCDADLHTRHGNFFGIHCDRELTTIYRLCDICHTELKDGDSNPHKVCESLVSIIENAMSQKENW